MIHFDQIVTVCQKECALYGQFEGVLSVTFIQKSETNIEWRTIIQLQNENKDTEYLKIENENGKMSCQKARLPFGYRPFSTIKIDFSAAYEMAEAKAKSTCSIFKLYFPLSPFDTEPIWSMNFLNEIQIIVGANSGKVEVNDF